MEYEVYVIYDARANRYSTPMCFDNDAVAVRDFVTEGSKPYTRVNTHPEDYILFKIGIYHELDGTMQCNQAPERVCALSDYIVKETK